jgi:hypothetical protein
MSSQTTQKEVSADYADERRSEEAEKHNLWKSAKSADGELH